MTLRVVAVVGPCYSGLVVGMLDIVVDMLKRPLS